jgi:hypothetical protein
MCTVIAFLSKAEVRIQKNSEGWEKQSKSFLNTGGHPSERMPAKQKTSPYVLLVVHARSRGDKHSVSPQEKGRPDRRRSVSSVGFCQGALLRCEPGGRRGCYTASNTDQQIWSSIYIDFGCFDPILKSDARPTFTGNPAWVWCDPIG